MIGKEGEEKEKTGSSNQKKKEYSNKGKKERFCDSPVN